MTQKLSQSIEWLGLRLKVPDDWQVVTHGLSPELGSLVVVDRRRQRMTLSWTQCGQRPDLNQLLSDYRDRVLTDAPDAEIGALSLSRRWRTLKQTRGRAPEIVSRGVCFDAPSSRLVEALIVTRDDEPEDQGLVERLLDEITVTGSAAESTRYRIFGIDVDTPPGFRLTKTRVKPADVALTFERSHLEGGKSTRQSAAIRRLGMARAWHTGSLRDLVVRHEPKAGLSRFDPVEHRGHEALLASGTEAGPRYKRALGLLRDERVLAWSCEPENAIYEVLTKSPRGQPVQPSDFVIRCPHGGKS